MPSRDLCTLGDVTRYVPGYESDPNTDETLQALITSLSVDTYESTGREFTPRNTQPDTRIFDVDWWVSEERELPLGDLANTTSLVVEILAEDGTLDQTLNAGAYVALPRSRDAWEPITELIFPRLVQSPAEPARLAYRKQIRITGNFGFPQIPPSIVENIAKLVIVRYVTDVADHGTAFTDALDNINIAGMFKSATDGIERWRTPAIG